MSINFSTEAGGTVDDIEAQLKAQGSSPNFQKVPGVGDAAYYDTPTDDGAYIAGLSGPLAFHIVTGADASVSQLKALAQQVLAP